MMGRTHAASGLVAGLAVTALCGLHPLAAPGLAVVCRVSAYVPDLDHPDSTATRSLGPVSWLACWAVRNASARAGLPAHRGLAHSWVYAAGWALLCGGSAAVWLQPLAALWVAVFAGVGCVIGMLGDVPTRRSLRYFWWPSRRPLRWPGWLRFTTGGPVERGLFWVLVVAGCALLPARWRADGRCGP